MIRNFNKLDNGKKSVFVSCFFELTPRPPLLKREGEQIFEIISFQLKILPLLLPREGGRGDEFYTIFVDLFQHPLKIEILNFSNNPTRFIIPYDSSR